MPTISHTHEKYGTLIKAIFCTRGSLVERRDPATSESTRLWCQRPIWHQALVLSLVAGSLLSTSSYAEIHIQRLFFDNKKGLWEILVLKIQTVNTYSSTSSTQ
jgi:hypothetical protein